MRPRLVQVVAMQGVGRVRVVWSYDWHEYQVRAIDAAGEFFAEYFTDDKADAIDTAALILEDLARMAQAPA
jgi:hypothetical protein